MEFIVGGVVNSIERGLFMQKHAEVTWDEVFQQWRRYRLRFPQLFGDFPVTRVFVPCQPADGAFWGYDWIKPEQYEKRIKYVTEYPRAFLHLGDVLNKGTLHTLHMLAETKSDEERAAIWISAFLYDVLDSRIIHSDTGGFTYKLYSASYEILRSKYYLWHHAMRKLVPEIFLGYEFLAHVSFDSWEPFIEMAAIHAEIVMNRYVAVLYSSLEDDTQLSKELSLRLD